MSADLPPREGHPDPEVETQLEEIRDALDEGDVETGLRLAEELAAHHPDDAEVALELAAARYEAGAVRGTLEAARHALESGLEDEALARWYVAAAHHYLWDFESARALLEKMLAENEDFAEAWYLLAQICEIEGDEVGARRGYDRAHTLDDERFPIPYRIDETALRKAVQDARDALPERFQEVLDELAIAIEDLPSAEMARAESSSEDPLPPDVLGLFVGSDRFDQSVFDPVQLPGVIFLFQRNLERVSPDRATLVEEIRTTLWHELAHYLGFGEEDMPQLGLE